MDYRNQLPTAGPSVFPCSSFRLRKRNQKLLSSSYIVILCTILGSLSFYVHVVLL
jgi:hypothetical protein